jgi:hypothetical protein
VHLKKNNSGQLLIQTNVGLGAICAQNDFIKEEKVKNILYINNKKKAKQSSQL